MSRIIDLTQTYSEPMRGVSITQSTTLEKDGWNSKKLSLNSHAGTHMDAPLHFGVPGPTIDRLPLDHCMGDAWVVNLMGIAAKSLIGIEDLGKVAEVLVPGDSLLLKTGWSRNVLVPEYRNDLPRISPALARWCSEKKVKMLGLEPPSVADVNNLEEVTLIHEILFEGGVLIIEGLTNLDRIQEEKVQLIALPLKIKDGDGAPARVIAIEHSTF